MNNKSNESCKYYQAYAYEDFLLKIGFTRKDLILFSSQQTKIRTINRIA